MTSDEIIKEAYAQAAKTGEVFLPGLGEDEFQWAVNLLESYDVDDPDFINATFA